MPLTRSFPEAMRQTGNVEERGAYGGVDRSSDIPVSRYPALGEVGKEWLARKTRVRLGFLWVVMEILEGSVALRVRAAVSGRLEFCLVDNFESFQELSGCVLG